jgi:hypothetical protein
MMSLLKSPAGGTLWRWMQLRAVPDTAPHSPVLVEIVHAYFAFPLVGCAALSTTRSRKAASEVFRKTRIPLLASACPAGKWPPHPPERISLHFTPKENWRMV